MHAFSLVVQVVANAFPGIAEDTDAVRALRIAPCKCQRTHHIEPGTRVILSVHVRLQFGTTVHRHRHALAVIANVKCWERMRLVEK